MAERTKYGFAVMPGTMVVMTAGHAALMLAASKSDLRTRQKATVTGLLSGLAGIESGEFASAIRRSAWFACGCFDGRFR